MNSLHVLLLVGALVVNIPWFMMIRRRGRISSHTRATLRSFSRQHSSRPGSSKGDLYYRGSPTLKSHMRSGLLTKLQPHHLPLLFCYTCTLYILTRPDLGQKFHQAIAILMPSSAKSLQSSAKILHKSIIPEWISSHLPNDFPFAVPDSEDVRQSIKQIHSPVLQPQLLSQAGQALISILSMVTGLLLSYKSSSALGKWEKGKGVWIGAGAGSGGMSGGLKGEVRSAVRMISLIHNEPEEEEADLRNGETEADEPTGAAEPARQAQLHQRAGELVSLLVGFAFALHYHLAHIRTPLYKPPLSDLLPSDYLSTLRRTDGRVRFEKEDGMEDQTSYKTDVVRGSGRTAAPRGKRGDESPGPKARISPRSRPRSLPRPRSRVRLSRSAHSGESLDSDSRSQSNDQPSEYKADGRSTQTDTRELGSEGQQAEWARQFKQLNVPIDSPAVISGMLHTGDDMFHARTEGDAAFRAKESLTSGDPAKELDDIKGPEDGPLLGDTPPTTRRASAPKRHTSQQSKANGRPHPKLRRQPSAFSNPFPPNLPLSIIRLVESYVNQFVASESWTAAQGEKGYLLTRTLTKILSEAEMLSENPPPLSLSIHLTHLLLLYLLAIPAQLMPVLGKWTVPVALVAGWGLLGVEALSREVGAVFGTSENHIPTYLYCAEMLSETLDISPLFLEAYSRRVRDRLENEEELAGRLDELIEKGDPRVLVLTRLYERRVDYWTPNFGPNAS